jgi:hypothetical protein
MDEGGWRAHVDRHSLWGGELTMRRLIRILVVSASALAMTLTATLPAYAGDDEAPADVQAAYSSEALDYLRAADDSEVTVDQTGVPDFSSAAAFGTPHQVNLWSPELIAGKSFSEPISPLEEWLAPILGQGGEPLGTYRVWRPTSDSKAELAGYNDDIELARALLQIDDKSDLVSDPAIEAWYAVSDGSVTAVNQSAAREVPYPTSIADVAKIVSARYAEAIETSEEAGEGAAGGMPVDDRRPWYYGMDPWVLGAGVLLLIASAIGAVFWMRARRQAG